MKKKPETTYVLEASAEQMGVISMALEYYSRILMGQIGYLSDFFIGLPYEQLEELRKHLHAAGSIASGLPLHSYHSIRSPKIHDSARVAYDLHQVIRHRLAWDKSPDGNKYHQVQFDEPLKTSTESKLATIQKK